MHAHNQRPSQWPHLFAIAIDLLDQVRRATGNYPFDWSFGGGTAMMIQIGHRESHDIDIFLNDGQILRFLDPTKTALHFIEPPASYEGDGARFQKFAFERTGEIDFIVAGSLTSAPSLVREVEGHLVHLETIAEIITKNVYFRGQEARARDVFDIGAATRCHRNELVAALRLFPEEVASARAPQCPQSRICCTHNCATDDPASLS